MDEQVANKFTKKMISNWVNPNPVGHQATHNSLQNPNPSYHTTAANPNSSTTSNSLMAAGLSGHGTNPIVTSKNISHMSKSYLTNSSSSGAPGTTSSKAIAGQGSKNRTTRITETIRSLIT